MPTTCWASEVGAGVAVPTAPPINSGPQFWVTFPCNLLESALARGHREGLWRPLLVARAVVGSEEDMGAGDHKLLGGGPLVTLVSGVGWVVPQALALSVGRPLFHGCRGAVTSRGLPGAAVVTEHK